jgi:hypothetical protein
MPRCTPRGKRRPLQANRICGHRSQDVHEQLVLGWKTAQEEAAAMVNFWNRVLFERNIDYLDVLPLQPECEHGQSMSGVFSIAAHSALQYLPDVITHEQTGCAHLWPFSVVISFLLASNQRCLYSYRFSHPSPTGKNDGHSWYAGRTLAGNLRPLSRRCQTVTQSQFWNRKMLNNSYAAKVARNATSKARPRMTILRTWWFAS